MNTILEHIDLWTTAQTPKTSGRGNRADNQQLLGIQKLRELILELAVRGKLVPQDPSDEPASNLLKKIEAEKKSLVKEGKIKKQEVLPEVGEDEKPFDLPNGWEWVKIRNIGFDWGQKTPDCDFTYIEVSAIDNLKGVVKEPTILSANEAPSRARKIVKLGTVIYSTVRPYLKNICVIEENYSPEPIASTAFAILHPFVEMPGRYFLYYFQSPVFVRYVENVQTGIAYPAINDKQFFGGIIPLPPLAEQHRIVAKVDELMALCDQLEQQQTENNQLHQTLVETLLENLTQANSPAEQAEAWQRIANQFDTLFTSEYSIDQLKQTILQLAVMGKLVPQNPADEPASELLKKIAKEKARLAEDGKIKKQAPLPKITDKDKPFELPEGWEFVRLDELCSLITKGSSPKWQGVTYTDNPNDVLFVTSENVGSYCLLFDNKKYVERKFNEIEPRSVLMKGDYLMNIVGGSIGRTAIYDIDDLANINQAVCLIRVLPDVLDKQYLLHFFNSTICISYMFDKQVDNARANLSMGNISKFVIPFPPLAEQHCIVAKVDELFALCDGLKERLAKAQTTQNLLAETVVAQALVNKPAGKVVYVANEQMNLAAEPE